MLNCKQVSQLVSDSMNQTLPFWKRVQVRMHLMMCSLCRRFMKQTRFLHDAAHHYEKHVEANANHPDATLSSEARERIKQALRA